MCNATRFYWKIVLKTKASPCNNYMMDSAFRISRKTTFDVLCFVCRKWGCNKWGLKGCLAALPGNRPKSAFFLRFPWICLNPHLLNPHLRHSNLRLLWFFGGFGASKRPATSQAEMPPSVVPPLSFPNSRAVWVEGGVSRILDSKSSRLDTSWAFLKIYGLSWVFGPTFYSKISFSTQFYSKKMQFF